MTDVLQRESASSVSVDRLAVDTDRFVLSAGHGSALLYGLLHIFGYDLPEAELRRFRQLGSRTPGHPEFGHTPGVECTTGPLGQGLAMAVGMARYTPGPQSTTVSIEAGSTAGWDGLVDLAIGIDEFGTCGPGNEVLAHHGFTIDSVLVRIREYLDRP